MSRRPQPRHGTARGAIFAGALLAAAVVCGGPSARADAPPIVAIGDVHGAYDELVAVLQAAGLVDGRLRWTGGAARLVLLGDVIDRGTGSLRALELIARLQREAPERGGRVQLVLGNHEVMNLLGDVAYVSPEDFAAYAAEEPAELRDAAWRRFSARQRGRDEPALREQFAQRYPPGFFGQRRAFARHGRLGEWLLEQPVIATIDRTAFVHGGLPESVAGMSAAAINAAYASLLHDYMDAVEALDAAGVLHAEDTFAERARIAATVVAAQPSAVVPAIRAAAARVAQLSRSPLLGDGAVFWYRGSAACGPAIERDRVLAELHVLGADRVVIGHTPTPSGRIESRLDGAVVRADAGMLQSYFHGHAAAVVIRGDAVRALYADGTEAAPLVEQPAVPRRAGDDDAALEQWLSEVALPELRPGRATRVELERGGRRVAAIARGGAAQGGRVVLPEVAAYRLDRLLGLDLVPVAVVRTSAGRAFSLALDTSELPDERERRERGAGVAAWCPLADQFDAMYAFDALIHEDGRTAADLRYAPESWQVVLASNQAAFGVELERPRRLAAVRIEPSPYLRARLGGLDAAGLERSLGDVLDERAIAAILARRDRLLREEAGEQR